MTTLDDLRAMPPGADRVRAINAWLAIRHAQERHALDLRDADVVMVHAHELASGGASRIWIRLAEMLGMSKSNLRFIVGRNGR